MQLRTRPGFWFRAPKASIVTMADWHTRMGIENLLPALRPPEGYVVDWEGIPAGFAGEEYPVGLHAKAVFRYLREISKATEIPEEVILSEADLDGQWAIVSATVEKCVRDFGPLVKDFGAWGFFGRYRLRGIVEASMMGEDEKKPRDSGEAVPQDRPIVPRLRGTIKALNYDLTSPLYLPDHYEPKAGGSGNAVTSPTTPGVTVPGGSDEALYFDQAWVKYAIAVFMAGRIRCEIPPINVPVPVDFYVWAARAIGLLCTPKRRLSAEDRRSNQHFLTNRLASLQVVPGEASTLTFAAELLDHLALIARYNKSRGNPVTIEVKTCRATNCDNQVYSQDGRYGYCDACRDNGVQDAERAKRYRENKG